MYLAGEDTAIKLKIRADFDELEVCGYLFTHANGDDITRNEILCLHLNEGGVTEDQNIRWQHSLDRSHNTGGRKVLPCIEDGLNRQDEKKYDCQSQVRCLRVRFTEWLPVCRVRYTFLGRKDVC